MKSLYDVLGARADDDAQAIKRAFRNAVKAYHPDLHPDDPEAALRFRRIVTANTILRDEKQRAAYDEMLARERQQLRLKHDQQLLQLQYRRRRRMKVGATAAVVAIFALAGGYGLFMPMPTTAVVEVMRDQPPASKTATIVEAIKKDKAGMAATVAAAAPAGGTPAVPGDARPPPTDRVPPSADEPRITAHASAAGADITGDTLRQGASPSRSDAPADARQEPPLPNDPNVYRAMGTISYRVGDFPRAIVSLDEAIRLNPKDAQAYNIRGNAWDEIGAFENALADYDAAIRLAPNNPVFFHDRAIMWHRRGDLNKALSDLDQAVRLTFSDPNIYCDRGLIWYEKGSHGQAIADFEHAVKLDPDFARACISRGLLLHRDSEFNVAFADIEKTIHVSPGVFDVSRRLTSRP